MARYIKYVALVAALGFLGSIYSCSRDDAFVGIEMPYRYQFDFPAGLNSLNTHFFVRNNLPTNASNILGPDGAERIIPLQARLTSNDNINWAFVREVEVQISDPNNPGLKIPVFFREEIPQNIGNGIDLIPTLTDVTDLMQLDAVDVTFEIRLWVTSSFTFTADAFITFGAQ